jgi:hypothetical protein
VARSDSDQTDVEAPEAEAVLTGSDWDVAVWDEDVCGGGVRNYELLRGATGLGHSVALAVRGTSTARTILVNLDALTEGGGWL